MCPIFEPTKIFSVKKYQTPSPLPLINMSALQIHSTQSDTRLADDDPHVNACVESRVLKSVASDSDAAFACKPLLPAALVHEAMLTHMQYDTMQRASWALDRHGAFLLSDGTGVGKGRSIAAVVLEFVSRHADARVLWFSINSSLRAIARRDIAVMGRFGERVRWGDNVTYFSYPMLRCDAVFARACEYLRGPHVLVVMDECHWLRRKSPATARIAGLLESAPSARVMFVSATPASCASHIHYLARLSPQIADGTAEALARKCGPVVLELLTIQLKGEGRLLSRMLSQKGVQVETLRVNVTPADTLLYDACCRAFRDARCGAKRTPCHQLFYRNLITSFKVAAILERVDQELASGNSVVLCVQSTGAACAQRNNDDATSMCDDYTRRHVPVVASGGARLWFPPNLTDALRERLGSERFADLTGRSSHVERRLAIAEFQSGRKRVALLSQAGSTGISLHSDHAAAQKRVQIIVELPWTSEAFVQQCGRVHRAHAQHAPRYVIVRTDIPAEQRFFASLQQRLRNLSSITRADQTGDDDDVGAVLRRTFTSTCTESKRLVALEILYRSASARIGKHASRADATPSASPGPSLVKDILAVLARGGDGAETGVEGADAEGARRLRGREQWMVDCEAFVPQSKLWRATAWSVQIHEYTNPAFRRSVRALLLVWRRESSGNHFCKLPEAILHVIFDKLCDDVHDVRAPFLHGVMSREGFQPTDLPGMSLGGIYNLMLRMPIASQRTLHRMLSTHTSKRVQQKTRITVAEAVRRALPCNASFHNVSRRDDADGTIRIHVDVHAPMPTRADAVIVYNNTRYGAVYDAQGGAWLYTPDAGGEDVALGPSQVAMLRASGAVGTGDTRDITRRMKNKARSVARRAFRQSGEYVIATRRHLPLFEASQRVVITHDAASSDEARLFGDSFTGLLVAKPP
tara:strand:- start:1205 stop:3979 length:2775 start_codon:yes stop_codon:yes gene_type:complete